MRITYVGGNTSGGSSTLDLATQPNPPTWPSGIQPGDYAVLMWIFQSTQTFTDPAGFNFLASQNSNTGSATTRLFSKVCTGSESGTFSLANGVANRQGACLAIYRGTHKSAPIISGDWTSVAETVGGTTHASPPETLNVADCAALTFIGERATLSTGGSSTYSHASFTNRLTTNGLSTGTGGVILSMADDGLTTDRKSGTTVSPGNWIGDGTTSQQVMWTILLRPREYEGWGVDL
jgi:hypothetical protein